MGLQYESCGKAARFFVWLMAFYLSPLLLSLACSRRHADCLRAHEELLKLGVAAFAAGQEMSRGIVNLQNARKIADFPFPFPYHQAGILSLEPCLISTD